MLNNFFFNENCVVDDMVQPDGREMTIYYTACAYYAGLTKATKINSEYVILIFLRQQWLRERASMLPSTYTVLLSPSHESILVHHTTLHCVDFSSHCLRTKYASALVIRHRQFTFFEHDDNINKNQSSKLDLVVMLATCICKYSLKSCPGDPSVLNEILRGLPQCLKLNSGTVKYLHADHGRHFPRTFQFTIHCHPIILRRILQSSYRGKAPLVMKRS